MITNNYPPTAPDLSPASSCRTARPSPAVRPDIRTAPGDPRDEGGTGLKGAGGLGAPGAAGSEEQLWGGCSLMQLGRGGKGGVNEPF